MHIYVCIDNIYVTVIIIEKKSGSGIWGKLEEGKERGGYVIIF